MQLHSKIFFNNFSCFNVYFYGKDVIIYKASSMLVVCNVIELNVYNINNI